MPSGAYICQMPGHRLSRVAKGTHTFRKRPTLSSILVCIRH